MALHNTPDSTRGDIVHYRIERGAAALGTDGPLGTVEQIVVDRETGELRALIVRSGDGGSEFELPAEHVQSATGDQVQLNIGRADMAARPELATPYDPSQYVPVYQGETATTRNATQTAQETERPVVTEVEDNAAEIVAPQMETLTESDVTPTPMAAPTDTAAGQATTWTPRDSALDTAPADTSATDEAITAPQATPPKSESTRPAVTGTLIGGKPTTSGMGEKSTVPHSDEAPYNQAPTPPGSQYPPPSPGMVQAFQEAGSEPGADYIDLDEPVDTQPTQPMDDLSAHAAQPIDTMPTAPLQPPATLAPTEGLSSPPEPLRMSTVADEPVGSLETTPPQPVNYGGTGSAMASETELRFERAPISDMLPLPLLIAAGVVAAGAIGGIILRRQSPPNAQVKSKVRQASGALQDLLGNAGGSASDAARATQRAAKSTKRGAKRAARRGSWFVRGVLAGAGAAVLYAPDSGDHLRAQLTSAANRVLRRAS
ncbi:MAG TPA: PRC-barrel domain-containing protein [Ktedonobacterales bacterium]|nr:PRC-barrel domain-containing protein [Ktedonobacterales bacterium]